MEPASYECKFCIDQKHNGEHFEIQVVMLAVLTTASAIHSFHVALVLDCKSHIPGNIICHICRALFDRVATREDCVLGHMPYC